MIKVKKPVLRPYFSRDDATHVLYGFENDELFIHFNDKKFSSLLDLVQDLDYVEYKDLKFYSYEDLLNKNNESITPIVHQLKASFLGQIAC